jgi:hypothetical protein
MTREFSGHHGMAKARGCAHVAVSNFSRMFPKLDSLFLSEEEAAILGGPGGLMHDFDGVSPDCAIPSGYIFFAQFVDHDVTLDATSKLRIADPADVPGPAAVAKLPNIRSVSLDLDCVYGFGPEGSPHLYDPARPGRLAENPNGHDLARSPGGVALIGDPRNDENMFISQIQLLMHRFHNRLHDERVWQADPTKPFNRFEAAQEETRFHYQWIVLFDFLKRLCDEDVWRFGVERILDASAKFPLVYGPDAHGHLPMPVEFSTSAYRVGHTLVRSVLACNDDHTDIELFDARFGTTGFSGLPAELAVDWKWLLPVDPHHRPRMCKAVDPLLADELQNLPVVGSRNPLDRALAFRNVLRSSSLGVPAGQDVRDALIAAGWPIAVVDLELDKVPGWAKLDAIPRADGRSLRDATPLFYHLLRESEVASDGQRYGPTGSALLLEVFGGALRLCGTSFLHHPGWTPDACVARKADGSVQAFDMARIVSDPDYYPFELADVARFVAS